MQHAFTEGILHKPLIFSSDSLPDRVALTQNMFRPFDLD